MDEKEALHSVNQYNQIYLRKKIALTSECRIKASRIKTIASWLADTRSATR